VIRDLDRTLARLLRDKVPLRDEHIAFDMPNDAFRAGLSRASLAVDVYLYDLRENHDLRSPEWKMERQPDGRVVKRRPKVWMDLFYMITAWSPADPPDVLAEHALLSRILRTLLRYSTIPAEVLQGTLVGKELPLSMLVAQPDGMRRPSEFWGTLRQAPRPAIHLVVTAAVEPAALSDEPVSLTPVVSRGLGHGLGVGRVYQMDVRPSLPRHCGQGTQLRRMEITPLLAAQLQLAVFASCRVMRIIQVRPLAGHEWVLIDDPANPEFVRLGEIPGAGEQEVTVVPPLHFAHDPTATPIALRQVTAPESDVVVTHLDAPASAGSDTLPVAERQNITVGDALYISDGERTEVVEVTAVPGGPGPGDITVRPTLRFAHPAGRNLYQRILAAAPPDPAAATRLAQPAAQPGSPIVLDRGLAPEGTVLMVGAGPDVEFCRLDTAAVGGAPVAVTPSLRNNHAAGTPLRRLTEAEAIGRLHVAVRAESSEVAVIGDPTAVENARRRERPLVSAGEVLQLTDPAQPASFQVVAVTETPGAFRGTAEEFIAVGGWVNDDATPPNPVVGAEVTLREPGLMARTNAEGQFTFTNLLPGTYALQVTATGYQDGGRVVQVPAQSVDEYRIVLSP
jgi:hypothetical protein